jgi:hypothetical protein
MVKQDKKKIWYFHQIPQKNPKKNFLSLTRFDNDATYLCLKH